MTARSTGSATITLGLLSIPVKLYSTAGEERSVSFNMLHDADSARLKQQYVCTQCNEVVDRDHTLKGYEHAKGQYVSFSPAELEAIDAVATQTIAIAEFVPDGEVDPIYVEKSYYLAADKGSERVVALLALALEKTRRVAIATYSARGRQHLVAVRQHPSYMHVLVLHQLRYEHEVRSAADVPGGDVGATDSKTLALACALIEQEHCAVFDPGKYSDEVYERTVKLIEAKVAGGEITAAPAAAPPTVIDLMTSLRASLKSPEAAAPAIATPRTRTARASSAAAKRTKPKTAAKRAARK